MFKAHYIARVLLVPAILVTIGATAVRATDANGNPVIAAVGDMACDPRNPKFNNNNGTTAACGELRTSNQLTNETTLDRLLLVGDIQYDCDDLSGFQASYTPSYGRFNPIAYPVPGNHEYKTGAGRYGGTCPTSNKTALNYFNYFQNSGGSAGHGYYSFDMGTWHVIALNSNCSNIGGCTATSAQGKWLASDLNNTHQPCILTYFHHPRWTGVSSNDSTVAPFWTVLYQHHADIILNGHIHDYQRFAPMDPNGKADANGLLELIVGSGGESQQKWSTTATPKHVTAFLTFGYLKMLLEPGEYDASFVRYDGSVLDHFTGTCHAK